MSVKTEHVLLYFIVLFLKTNTIKCLFPGRLRSNIDLLTSSSSCSWKDYSNQRRTAPPLQSPYFLQEVETFPETLRKASTADSSVSRSTWRVKTEKKTLRGLSKLRNGPFFLFKQTISSVCSGRQIIQCWIWTLLQMFKLSHRS